MNNEEAQKMFDLAQTLKETAKAIESEARERLAAKAAKDFPWQEFDWKAVYDAPFYDLYGTPRSEKATQIMNLMSKQNQLGELGLTACLRSAGTRLELRGRLSFSEFKKWLAQHSEAFTEFISTIEEIFNKNLKEAQAQLDDWKNFVASQIQKGATPHNEVPWQDVLEGKEQAPVRIDLRESPLYTIRSITPGDYIYARQGEAWGFDNPTGFINDDDGALTHAENTLAVLYKYLGHGIAQLVRPEKLTSSSIKVSK